MVRSIGADHVIDYTSEDFTRLGLYYDLVLDAVGNRSLSDCKRVLNPKGVYVAVAGTVARSLWILLTGRKRMIPMLATTNKNDLLFLQELLQSGKVMPVIDRRYQLGEVSEAIEYVETGRAQGKVIITM